MHSLMFAEPVTLHADKAQSLDQLWHEAAQIGGVRIWQYKPGHPIEVTISFERHTGTKIEAKASDQNVAYAIAKAINEAREMGGGAA